MDNVAAATTATDDAVSPPPTAEAATSSSSGAMELDQDIKRRVAMTRKFTQLRADIAGPERR